MIAEIKAGEVPLPTNSEPDAAEILQPQEPSAKKAPEPLSFLEIVADRKAAEKAREVEGDHIAEIMRKLNTAEAEAKKAKEALSGMNELIESAERDRDKFKEFLEKAEAELEKLREAPKANPVEIVDLKQVLAAYGDITADEAKAYKDEVEAYDLTPEQVEDLKDNLVALQKKNDELSLNPESSDPLTRWLGNLGPKLNEEVIKPALADQKKELAAAAKLDKDAALAKQKTELDTAHQREIEKWRQEKETLEGEKTELYTLLADEQEARKTAETSLTEQRQQLEADKKELQSKLDGIAKFFIK